MLDEVRGRNLTIEERSFLHEPSDTLSLYEFFINDYTDETVERLMYRVFKIIERIHYYLEDVDDVKLSYINRRFRNVISSTNSLIEAFIRQS